MKCSNCNSEMKEDRNGFYCESCDREKKKSDDFKEGLSRGMI